MGTAGGRLCGHGRFGQKMLLCRLETTANDGVSKRIVDENSEQEYEKKKTYTTHVYTTAATDIIIVVVVVEPT
jgi:hypothetical protein